MKNEYVIIAEKELVNVRVRTKLNEFTKFGESDEIVFPFLCISAFAIILVAVSLVLQTFAQAAERGNTKELSDSQ